MVRTRGLEPPQDCSYQNLNLARLPIPPCPQIYFKSNSISPVYSANFLIHNMNMLEPESNETSPTIAHSVELRENPPGRKPLPCATSADSGAKVLQRKVPRVVGDTAYITLTRGTEAIIDSTDVHLVAGRNWHLNLKGNSPYARGHGGVRTKKVELHRLICGAAQGDIVDHRNGNTLDNRRSNLRICSNRENLQNAGKFDPGAASPYKGVCLGYKGQFKAQIMADGKRIYLGSFPTPELAAQAYDTAARKHFGEFARCNFNHASITPAIAGAVEVRAC